VTSILEKLHAHLPDARIDLVVRNGNDGLFTGHPFIHTLHVWNKGEGKMRALFKLIRDLRRTRYDHIINAQRFFSTGLMTVLARGGEKVGYDKNPLSFLFSRRVKHVIGDGRHEVDRLNALITHLTDEARPLPRLYPTPKAREEAEQLVRAHLKDQRKYVCIAPASVWYTKQWPAEKWVELMKRLPMDLEVFVIGAPGDGDLGARIIASRADRACWGRPP
jgi:ADP-heptose:LPS heptosyltransferase